MLELTILDDYRSTTEPDTCSYLSSEQSMMDYRVILHLTQREYRELLARGWRKHGIHIFRPACATCRKCRSLRVDLSRLEFTKSQRRILKKNRNVELVVRPPTVSREHVAIYNRFHEFKHQNRDWPHRRITQVEYAESFLAGDYEFAREFLYYRAGQLVGVGLVDVAMDVSSSVYFFHHPDWRQDSPGTFSVLRELEYASQQGYRYHYMGYWIRENQSMAYKNRFRVHQLLEAHVDDQERPTWTDVG